MLPRQECDIMEIGMGCIMDPVITHLRWHLILGRWQGHVVESNDGCLQFVSGGTLNENKYDRYKARRCTLSFVFDVSFIVPALHGPALPLFYPVFPHLSFSRPVSSDSEM
jgi:hypothetical protein